MPFSPSNGTLRLAIVGKYGGSEEIVNVVHVQKANDALFEPFDQVAIGQAMQRFDHCWRNFLQGISNNVNWTEIRARDLSSETGLVGLRPVSMTGPATIEAAPPSICFLVRWKTGKAGRGANGRNYIPGVVEGEVDGMGRLTDAAHIRMQSQATAFLNTMAGPTSADTPGPPLDLVVLHGLKGISQERFADKVITPNVSKLIGTQRRRLPRRV